MQAVSAGGCPLTPQDIVRIERRALVALQRARVPVLVGGGAAVVQYTGAPREVNDLDLFLRPEDFERAAIVLSAECCEVERIHPHWLGKARAGGHVIDLIYSSGNGLMPVDQAWFDHAQRTRMHGISVLLVPIVEMIWTKMFVMERERYDGADVSHLLLHLGARIDWRRLEARVGEHWRVLLSHLLLFGYVYPSRRRLVPQDLMNSLLARLLAEQQALPVEDRVCRGTLLSRQQYLQDVQAGGWMDARLLAGSMSEHEVDHWTAAIADDGDCAPSSSRSDLPS